MKFGRKEFFKAAALGIISVPFAIKGCYGQNIAQNNAKKNASNNNSISDEKITWKMVTTWPPNFPVLGQGAVLFADWVREMSAGRLDIQVFGGGELVPALQVFDAVRNGAADVAHGCAYYWAGKNPASQFFATVPFGMNAQQMNAWLYSGGGLELWEELYDKYNLIPMPAGNTGVQMGGWFKREINSMADLQGLKMRMPGLGGKVLEKAGANPVLLAGGEIYTGLERGVIDATEWIGPYHDRKIGFHQIAKYYYSPGWHEPGTTLEIFFNKEKFNSLSPDLQAICRAAAARSNMWMLSEFEAQNSIHLQKIKNETDVEIRKFPDEVLKQLKKYTDEVIEEIVANDDFAKRVYESYSSFKKNANTWSEVTEKVYYNSIQI